MEILARRVRYHPAYLPARIVTNLRNHGLSVTLLAIVVGCQLMLAVAVGVLTAKALHVYRWIGILAGILAWLILAIGVVQSAGGLRVWWDGFRYEPNDGCFGDE